MKKICIFAKKKRATAHDLTQFLKQMGFYQLAQKSKTHAGHSKKETMIPQEVLLRTLLAHKKFKENYWLQKQRNAISTFVRTKHYKGFRFLYRLPVRGQRTRTNRKTARKRNNA